MHVIGEYLKGKQKRVNDKQLIQVAKGFYKTDKSIKQKIKQNYKAQTRNKVNIITHIRMTNQRHRKTFQSSHWRGKAHDFHRRNKTGRNNEMLEKKKRTASKCHKNKMPSQKLMANEYVFENISQIYTFSKKTKPTNLPADQI